MKKEMWLTTMNPKCKPSTKIMATKEPHALTKTSVLLNRDLPYVTNFPKYYVKDILELESDKPQSDKSLNKDNNQNMK